MSFILAGTAIVSAGIGIYKTVQGAKAKKEAAKAQKKAQAEMDKYKAEFAQLDTSNPYKDLQNRVTNVYEDLTVNQQQAQFEAQQGQQQRANIMQGLKGAAGGSGIAGLAQAMANQGQLATQRASASIGQQESRNQIAKAQGESMVQAGQTEVDSLKGKGEILSRGWERDKVATQLGMSQGELGTAKADKAAAQSQINEGIGQVGSAAASYLGGVGGGDFSKRTTDPNRTYDLSQATVSGGGVDNTNALYQSSVDFQGGTGATTIDQFGNTQFKDLSGMSIHDKYDRFGNPILKKKKK